MVAEVVPRIIKGKDVDIVVGYRLVNEIQKLLNLLWEVRLSHVYREGTWCADALASVGCFEVEPLIVYELCPVLVGQLLLGGRLRVSTPCCIVG